MSTANSTPYWIRSFSSTVPATISPAVEPEMRAEYDIRGGQRGKYYRAYRPTVWRQIIAYLQALYR